MFKDPVLRKKLMKALFKQGKRKKRSNRKIITDLQDKLCLKFKSEMHKMDYKQRMKELVRISELKFPFKYNLYKKYRKITRPVWKGICKVCERLKAYCFHHMIQLINGGRDSGANRIRICMVCHKRIHPHMNIKEKVDLDEEFQEMIAIDDFKENGGL